MGWRDSAKGVGSPNGAIAETNSRCGYEGATLVLEVGFCGTGAGNFAFLRYNPPKMNKMIAKAKITNIDSIIVKAIISKSFAFFDRTAFISFPSPLSPKMVGVKLF